MSKKIPVIVLCAVAVAPLIAFAADIRASDKVTIATDEKVASNLYLAAGTVSAAGSVGGDEIVVGGDVTLTGPVSQDMLAAGGNISVTGAIGGDARIAGGNVVISAPVKGDVVIAAGQATLSGSSIGGDVLWAGGELRITSPVNGNLQLRGGDVVIDAPVKGSITFKGGSLKLGSRAVIEGNLSYTTPDKVSIEDGAVVKGKTDYAPAPTKPSPGIMAAVASLAFLGRVLMTLACAMTLGLIFNRYSRDLVANIAEQPLVELGRGFATMVLLPIASLILLSTLVGIPFGILGFISFGALIVYSWIVTPIVVGSFIHKAIWKTPLYSVTWATITIGVFAYILIGLIPFIGWLFKFVAALITIGGVIRVKWDIAKEWR